MARAKKKYRVINEAGKMVETSIPGILGGYRPGKIYGRLSCRSGMRMNRENRVFFSSRRAALNAGYRACKNCKP